MLAFILYFFNRLLDSFLPVVVCSGEVAAVGVSVKNKGDDQVSNIYIIFSRNTDSKELMKVNFQLFYKNFLVPSLSIVLLVGCYFIFP